MAGPMAGPMGGEAGQGEAGTPPPLDKKELKAQAKAAKAAEKEAAKAAKAAEKEAAKAAKQQATADGGKSAQKALKAAEKAKKQAEKDLKKEQKKIDKAAKKKAKKVATVVIVGERTEVAKQAAGHDAWTDDVDDGSTVEAVGPKPAVRSPVETSGASPAVSKLVVTPLGGESTPETADAVAFLNPVASVRNCWLQRRDKKCLVLYDHDSDNFLACARLVQNKVGKDQFWRIYRSPQAMTCDKSQLTKDERLAYVGKLDKVLSGPKGVPDKFVLFDQHTDTKQEHLLITLKKKKKAAAYKVRCPNITCFGEVIYRSTEPTLDKATKVHTYPKMTLQKTKESIKNFVLELEGVLNSSEDPAVEMGKRLDDEWDLRVRAPFSIYQAFGMAVTACYGT